jgi:ubiquinone/menaquinone biosynthesis C-methylase UbiE
MYNNLVNIHDALDLVRMGPKVVNKVISRLTLSKSEQVKAKWTYEPSADCSWWDVPEVVERWNRMISGDPKVDHYRYITGKYLSGKKPPIGLSVGCGNGSKELRWVESCNFGRLDAYDLSDSGIQMARTNAEKAGYADKLKFAVGDVFDIKAEPGHYDVIIGEHAVHHFSPLEEILMRINTLLKDDGYFLVNEFVGPTRFQWTDKQLAAINGLLAILPRKYKLLPDRSIKPGIVRPSRLRMIMRDPSESIESSKIRPLLAKIFDVVELKEYGGTILHLLFNGIAQNFLSPDPETKHWLRICFETEDALIASGELQSDFIVAICRKRVSQPAFRTALP